MMFKKLHISGFLIAVLLSCQTEEEPMVVLSATVQTETIQEHSASVSVSIFARNGGTVSARGLCWSTEQDPSVDSEGCWREETSSTEGYSCHMEGLEDNTLYHVRAFSETSAGLVYSIQTSFKTKRYYTSPVLSACLAENVGVKTATLKSSVTDNGGYDVDSRGFCFVASDDASLSLTIENSIVVEADKGSGDFSLNLTGLTRATTYVACAYARNTKGTSYSENVVFTTVDAAEPLPRIEAVSSGNVSFISAVVYGNIPENQSLVSWGVVYMPTPDDADIETLLNVNSASKVIGPADLTSGRVSLELAGLSPNTSYSFRFYAENESGIAYSQTLTFETEAFGRFILVESGSFEMGADEGDPGYDAKFGTAPKHTVTITKDFYIGAYEVTAGEYIKFLNSIKAVDVSKNAVLPDSYGELAGKIVYRFKSMGAVLSRSDGKWTAGGGEAMACNSVTWLGAKVYCEWLTANDRNGNVYRLPTEAEWEYAAIGGNKSKGYKYSGGNDLNDVAVKKDGTAQICIPGTKQPNELGIYDMSGNLWEFVSDLSDYDGKEKKVVSGYFQYCVDTYGDNTVDPKGYEVPVSTDGIVYHIVKGGSGNDGGNQFCPGYRRVDRNTDEYAHDTGGFRVLKEVK